MEKKNTILLTIIAIATLLVTIIGATFAYFASNINTNNNIAVSVNTSNNTASFIASSDDNINLNIESYMMQQGDAEEDKLSNVQAIANNLVADANLNVSLTASESGHLTECTYDIVWIWEEESSDFTSGDNSDAVENAKKKVSGNTIYPTKYYIRSENQTGGGYLY